MSCHEVAFLSDLKTISFAGHIHPLILTKIKKKKLNEIVYHISCSRTKCLKNKPCVVIKMRKMRGDVGKKTPKKGWIIPHFYDVTRLIFVDTLSNYLIN